MTAAHDKPVRRLVGPGLLTLRRLAPRRDRVATARASAFATAMRVVDRIHRDATHRRTAAEPSAAARLADHDVLLIRVRYRADRRPTFGSHHAQLPGGEAQKRISLIATDQLCVSSCRTRYLAALSWFHLDIVDDRAERHAAHRHRIPGPNIDPFARDDGVAGFEPLRRQDVGKFPILVTDQRDERSAVRIVFKALDGCWHIDLHALEIDDAVTSLTAAATPAHCYSTGVVATALPAQPFGQGFDRLALP